MPRCLSHTTEFLLLNHPPNNLRRVKQNKCFLHLLFHYSPKLYSLHVYWHVLSKDSSHTLQLTLFCILFPLALKLREESIKYSHPPCRHSPLKSKFLMSLAGQSFNHDYHDWHADGVLTPCPLYLGAICWRPHPSSQNPTGTCTVGDISDFCVAVTKFLMAEQETGNQTGMEARFKPRRHSPNSSRSALPPAISATTYMALPPGTKYSIQVPPPTWPYHLEPSIQHRSLYFIFKP